MILILSLTYTVFIALYFGLIRLIDCLDSKKKEILQFLMIYTPLLTIMACLVSFSQKEIWQKIT